MGKGDYKVTTGVLRLNGRHVSETLQARITKDF